jgi:hypothetical protein
VAAAFSFLVFTAFLGLLLIFNRRYAFLADLRVPNLAAHGSIGLAGWFTLVTYGVAYKLMGMFTLAEDRIRHRLAWTQLALTSAGLLLLAGAGFSGAPRWPSVVALILLLAGALIFGCQMTALYLQRRRRLPDIVYPFVLSAVALWAVSVALALAGAVAGLGAERPLWRVALWLGLMGWIGMMVLGHMYKINTFLAWLNKYADLVGKAEVPKLESLYEPGLGRAGWAVYAFGVVVAALGWAFTQEVVLVVGLAAVSLGVLVYLANQVLIFLR